MELKISVGVIEIINLVKQLPENELDKLRHELANRSQLPATSKAELKNFLLKSPVFTKDQVDKMANARNEINVWRKR